MRHAFTLIELLIVMSIIAILAALLLGGMRVGLQVARQARCCSNERQIAMAMLGYAQDQRGLMPVPFVPQTVTYPNVTLEFILADQIDHAGIWWCPANREALSAQKSIAGVTLVGRRSYGIPGMKADITPPKTGLTDNEQRAVLTYYGAVQTQQYPSFIRTARLPAIAATSFILCERHDLPAISGGSNRFADYGGLVVQGPTTTTCRDAHRQRNVFAFADGHIELIARADTVGSGMTVDMSQPTAFCYRDDPTKAQARGPWSILGGD